MTVLVGRHLIKYLESLYAIYDRIIIVRLKIRGNRIVEIEEYGPYEDVKERSIL